MRKTFGSFLVGILLLPAVLLGGQKTAVRNVTIQRATVLQTKGGTKSGVPAEINYQGWLGSATDTSAITDKLNMVFKLYDTVTGGTELWTESQDTVYVIKGVFNVLLGSVTPIPDSFFNNTSLYLETQVESEALSPRKKLTSVGYAIKSKRSDNATRADTATTAINLQGLDTTIFNGKYVSKSGDNMTGHLSVSATSANDMISSTQSGTGSAGYFQITNGSNTNPVLYGTTNGTGSAGHFQVSNASNSNPAVYGVTNGSGESMYGAASGSGIAVRGTTNGTGRAGYFSINNASNSTDAFYGTTNGSGNAIYGYTTGLGKAGYFQINNASNSNPAVQGSTNGSGSAVRGLASGISSAGGFEISNVSNSASALYGTTNGSGNALYGSTTGTGRAGYFNINNASNSADLLYLNSNGSGNFINASNGAYLSNGGTWTDASSREYKENIEDLRLDEAISTVRNLNPVKFNYKKYAGEKCVGFIAEDVPDLVATKDRKGLSPMDIVAALTKVVQEQQKNIQQQQKQINALKEKIDQLSK
ncbi:MAG: tail fiber domain-containing protein [bacterium]